MIDHSQIEVKRHTLGWVKTLIISHSGFEATLGELRVLNQLQYGKTTDEIAEILKVHPGTVRTQIDEVKARNQKGTQKPSTTEVVVQAYSRGLLFPIVIEHLEQQVSQI